MPDTFDAINQTVATNQDAAAQAAPRSVFDQVNGQGPDPLRASAYLGQQMAPERAATIIRLRDRTRLPADLIDRNLEQVQREADRPDFDPDAFRAASPVVAAWLAEQPTHMAVAKDDLPVLAGLERMVSASDEYAWDKGGAILGPFAGNNRTYYRSTADLLRALREQRTNAFLDELQRQQAGAEVERRFGRWGGRFVAGAAGSVAATQRMLGTGDGQAAERLAEGAAEAMPGALGDIVSGVGGLTADLPIMLAGSALSPLVALKRLQQGGKLARFAQASLGTAAMVQPLAMREGINVGRDEGWANGLTAWAIETIVPAAFGATGTEKVLAGLTSRGVAAAAAPGLARAAGRLLLDTGLEATEESVTELAHAIHEVSAGIDPHALDPDRIWRRLGVAGAVGGVAGGGFNLPGFIAQAVNRGQSPDREAQRLLQAANGQQVLEGVLAAASASATAGRSPEAARELFQNVVSQKAPNVYVDREAWDAHWRGRDMDPRAQAAKLGLAPTAYDEAAVTGTPLRFDTGRIAVDIAQDAQASAWLAQEGRLDPALMNAREAKDYVAALETAEDDPEAQVQRSAQEAAQGVQDELEQQLTAAGYDAGSARRTAAQMATAFRVLAARWNAGRKADAGDRLDARALFNEWNVGINRPVAEVLASPRKASDANEILRARREKLRAAEAAATAGDAERIAAQEATDRELAQAAAGDPGFAIIQEATAALESAPNVATIGDAMLALGAAFGFRPDATAPLTAEQRARGNLLAAALRVRGKSLTDLLIDAGIQAPTPAATTAAGAQAAPDDPALEKLAAAGLRLVDLVTAIRAGKGDLAELEQASALASEVAPAIDRLPLDQGRIDAVRAAVEYAQDGRTLGQPGPARRGSITFGRRDGQRQTDIRLFQGADLSTVLHESGHLYLELLGDLATREGAPADIRDDYATILAWLKTEPGKPITTDQHEQFARGFERYLMEGKAPSTAMAGPFARFAAWLSAIYREVKALAVDLTPEVRGVFDRLLATEDEIADAQRDLGDDPIFASAQEAGMTEAEFAAYQKARAEATQQAKDSLRSELMREITRERTAAWREIRQEVAIEVEAEVNRDRGYVAEAILRRGTLPGGIPLPPSMPAIKLDTADLKRRLPQGVTTKAFPGMHARAGGIPVDQAARILGFANADELLTTLAGLRPRKQMIDAETDLRMRQRFGDALTDGSIAEKAMDAMHNERRADVHLAEVRALATHVGKRVAPIEVMRAAAARKISATPVKDLLPQLYARAEAKARAALEKALAKQDFDAAWKAKQQELLAHEMYRAAIDAKRESEKILEYVKRFNEKKTRETIGKAGGWEWTVTKPDGATETVTSEDEAKALADRITGSRYERTSGYLEKIDEVMEGYEFRRVANRTIARRQSLREWAALQQAAGNPVPIPDSVLNDAQRTNWKQVPMEKLRGIRDTLALIAQLARNKNAMQREQNKLTLDQNAARLRATLERTHPRETIVEAGETAGWWPSFVAAHRKAANIARQMDGDEDAGAFWELLIQPLNEAATAEAIRLRQAKEKQEKIWSDWQKATTSDGWAPGDKRQFDGFHGGLTRMSAIMVALNWGNEGNRQRLLEGGQGRGKLTEAQVQAVLDSLTAADWDLVEGIWEHIDSYWSDIKALEQKTTGVPPAKVEASPFPTKHGIIRGGYFPIAYDGQETGRIETNDATEWAKQIQAQSYGSTTTARGHTKERSIGQGRRLDLDPGVIGKHITRVVHDLTHREALADAMRLLLHDDVRSAIDRRMGPATTKTLRQWIADIATGGTPPSATARFLGTLRRGFSISTMGYRATTAALQLTGFSNSAVRVGPVRMMKAIGTLFSSRDGEAAWKFVADMSTMMRERGQTMTREMNEILGQFRGGKFDRFQQAVGGKAFWLMSQVQSVVDRATWLAAYDKAIDEGKTKADAVAVADQTVLDTQSGGQTKDLAGVARDPHAQILTGAYTYGSLVFNQLYDQGARIRRNPKDFGTWAGAFGNMLLAAALPAAMSAVLRALLRNDWPDDEKDSIAERMAVETGQTLLGTMVGARELGGWFSGFDYSGPGVTKPFADLTKLGNQAVQGDLDKGLARAVVDSLGSALGLPSAQAWATGAGLYEWLDDPSIDIRAPLFGPPPQRR